MSHDYIEGKRRIRCLTSTLIRLEFSPVGHFEDRPSLAAVEAQMPRPFVATETDGEWTVLRTDRLEVRSRRPEEPFDRNNLEIRWSDGALMQFWRPGDRDYQNLGGTLRSLDRYGSDAAALDGVHPATLDSPDPSGTSWPAWLQCEVDPLYKDLHPDPPETFNRGHWLREAAKGHNEPPFLERTYNWYVDARKFCPGVLSRSGYWLLNDSDGAVLDADGFPVERQAPGSQDWYFFGYGKDYQRALGDFRQLCGPAPLPPRQSLGIMLSRWPAFSPEEARELVARFQEEGTPLSTLIMDMEWHTEGWGAWDLATDLLPDPEAFVAWCHDEGLHLVFNDHPLDIRSDDSHYAAYVAAADPEVREITYNDKTLDAARLDICDKQQNGAFLETCHRDIMDLGLDWWWNDGSRGQLRQTAGQLVANKTFWEEVDRPDRRGMLLARYGGVGSHRYGGFFTGDTAVGWEVLRLQVEFNIRAGHLGMSWISHDIGGFFTSKPCDRIDNELYARWLQFGVFNPILRFHSAPKAGSRLPWDYDGMGNWLFTRHALQPYLYTAGRTAYDTGIPVTRGMFLDAPRDPDAYRFDQYYFGPDILVAPVLDAGGEREVYLPEGRWWDFLGRERYTGKQTLTKTYDLDDVPLFVKAGTIIPTQGEHNARDAVSSGAMHAGHRQDLGLMVYPGADGVAELYEDDGTTNAYTDSGYCRTRFELLDTGAAMILTGRVAEGQPLGETRDLVVTVLANGMPLSAALNGRSPSRCEPWQERGFQLYFSDVPADTPFELRLILGG